MDFAQSAKQAKLFIMFLFTVSVNPNGGDKSIQGRPLQDEICMSGNSTDLTETACFHESSG